MKTSTLESINTRILDAAYACRANGVSIDDLAAEFFNVGEAEVDEEGDIAIRQPDLDAGMTYVSAGGAAEFLAWLESNQP